MSMYDTFDRTGAVEFDFPAAVVFRAVAEAVPKLKGFKVGDTNPTARHLSVATKASMFSWGEKVTVSVSEVAAQRAAMRIASGAKTIMGSATTHGKNRKNVEQIIRATSDLLDENGAAWTKELGIALPAASQPEPQSIEERLRQLTTLQEQGLINQEEFETRKQAILSEL